MKLLCCDGFCRPSDPQNPASPKVCQPPTSGTCSGISEKCATDADCCDPSRPLCRYQTELGHWACQGIIVCNG